MSADNRWCLDTGIFVAPLLANLPEATAQACKEWQARAATGAIEAVTSALTWDEIAWVAGRRRGQQFDFRRAGSFAAAARKVTGVTWLPVDEDVIDLAQRLLSEARFAPRDAIHAATALIHAEGRLVTLDGDFSDGLQLRGRPQLTVERLHCSG